MNEQELWDNFFKTGEVACYLEICRIRQEGEQEPNETDR